MTDEAANLAPNRQGDGELHSHRYRTARRAARLPSRGVARKPSPTLIADLALSPVTRGMLEEVGLRRLEQLPGTADEFLRTVPGLTGSALCEIVRALAKQGMTLPANIRLLPDERDLKMLRLRVVEGRVLSEIALAVGLSRERVRQRLHRVFGLTARPRRPRGRSPT